MNTDGKNSMQGKHPIAWWRLALVAVSLAACAACSSRGDGRVDVSGSVTWKGQPVPAGFVVFNPDVTAGNVGPQGMAPIDNGRYDTRSEGGRPVSPGAMRVSIQGFNAGSGGDEGARGARLFLPAEVTVTVPPDSAEVNLVVPESTKAL